MFVSGGVLLIFHFLFLFVADNFLLENFVCILFIKFYAGFEWIG